MASVVNKECNLIIVGKTGSGKSSLGNSLLDCTSSDEEPFEAEFRPTSVTVKCRRRKGLLNDGTLLSIVDTPGLFDNSFTEEQTQKEITRSIALSAPGPHAILFVLRIGRFTKEEIDSVDTLIKMFGIKSINYFIIVFTGKDQLGGTDPNHELHEFVKDSPKYLTDFVRECNSRYVGIANDPSSPTHDRDVKDVMELIYKTMKQNGNQNYTEAERVIQIEIERRKQELKAEEMRQIKKRLEKEDLERKKRLEKDDLERNKRLEMEERERNARAEQEERERNERLEKDEIERKKRWEKDDLERNKRLEKEERERNAREEHEERERRREQNLEELEKKRRVLKREDRERKERFERELAERQERIKEGEERRKKTEEEGKERKRKQKLEEGVMKDIDTDDIMNEDIVQELQVVKFGVKDKIKHFNKLEDVKNKKVTKLNRGRLPEADLRTLQEFHVRLKKDLVAFPLIDHLFQKGVIDDDELDVIKKVLEKGRAAGVRKMLQILHFSGRDAFRLFLECLEQEDVGYKELAYELKHHRCTSVQPNINTLQHFHERLKKDLVLYPLIDHLFQKNVINLDEMDIIEKGLERGRFAGVEKMLEILRFSREDDFRLFLECLVNVGYVELASELREHRYGGAQP